jgi:hypothetical protein
MNCLTAYSIHEFNLVVTILLITCLQYIDCHSTNYMLAIIILTAISGANHASFVGPPAFILGGKINHLS